MGTRQSNRLAPAPLPAFTQEVHLLLKWVALLFLATLWVLGETLSPLCRPPCSVFQSRASTARKDITPKCFALMFGTQTRCYVSTGLCAAKKIHKNECGFLGRILFVCVEQQRKCSLPLFICKVFVRLQEWNPFAFHVYVQFQGTTGSGATSSCLFALQRVLLRFILYRFFTVLPAVAAYGLSPETCAFNSSLSYNNNEITLKRQTLRSHPLRPSAFAGGEWLPANLPCNQRWRRGIHLVFSSRCLNCIRLFPNALKASKAPGDGVGRRERPSARRRGEPAVPPRRFLKKNSKSHV